jgi:hypothetical protein
MTAPPATTKPATTVRIIHAALTSGVILFAIVVFLVLGRAMAETDLPRVAMFALLGVSLAFTAVSVLVLRPRVPRRSTDESADLYWTTAATQALFTWALLEGGALLGLVTYALSGMTAALIVAAVPLVVLIAFHPGQLERA